MLPPVRWFWKRLLVLTVALVLGMTQQALATHLLGGEMTYRYLDAKGPAAAPLRYEITVTIYHNCLASSSTLRSAAIVGIFDPTTGKQITLKKVNYASLVDGAMSIAQTSLGECSDDTPPAGCTITGPTQPYRVQKFVGIVNLPSNTQGYYAVFTDATRSVDIANLDDPGSETLILYVSLNPVTLPNNSPIFSDFALAIICAGDTTILLNNAVDPDGDRLVYAFGQPYGDQSDIGVLPTSFPPKPYAPYAAGYGITTPLGTGAGHLATIDPATGIAHYGTPTQGKYAVAVDVSEYRTINGQEVLVGTTRRDLQLVVAACPNVKSPVLPPATTTPRSYTIEAGATLNLPIQVIQVDKHPLTMTVTSELLDGAGGHAATFNGSAGTVPTGSQAGSVTVTSSNGTVAGTLVYKSACNEARATPYDLSLVVKDNGCAGKTAVDVFRITVVKPTGPTNISGDKTVCGATPTHAYTAAGGTAASVSWRVVGGTIVGSATANPVQVSWTTAGTGRIVARGISQYGCPADSVALNVTVTTGTPPTVTLATPPAQCAGSSLTFTPVVANAGTSPTYAWFVNGTQVATTTTYTSNTLKNGDQVKVTVTPTAGLCGNAPVSATVSVTLTPATAATVTLATPATKCAGSSLSFTPTVSNAGSSPTYAWFVNGTQVATTATYSSATLKNGDQVKVTVTPTASTCNTGPVSATVTVSLTPITAATVTLATPAAQCAGSTLSFTPTVGNAGSLPTYAWYVNGTQVATTATYSSSTLKNGDQVKITVTPAAGTCSTGPVSAAVNVTLTPLATATVALATPATQCAGTALSFTPTIANAGASPTFAWFVNNAQVATTATYTSSTLKNGDQVKITVTPTAGTCSTGPVSATVTVSLTPLATATVSLPTPAAQCAGSTLSFTPTVGSAGASPTYAWFVNGAQVATTATYTSSTLNNDDQVKVTVTPTAGTCNTGAVSATVTVNLTPITAATVALATPAAQCAGTAFSFKPMVGNAGSSPTYAWFVNGAQVATTATYTSSTLKNGDQVKVTVTPAAGTCSTGPVSATVTISVTPLATATVALATPPTQCAGTALSFTPTVGNAGASPTYAWYVNGAQVATTATYASSTLKNGDQVKVTVTPTAGTCNTGPVSAAVNVTLTPLAVATVSLATPAAQCAGSTLSFTPTVSNAGASPTYAWYVNGTQVATTATYSSAALKNGDQVKITVTPTAGTCNTGAVSATATANLTPVTTATVALAAPAAQCAGSTLTLTPTVGNAGASPTYAWYVNGAQVATTATYTSSTLKNGDQVKVTVTPTAGTCNTGPVSATATISITPLTTATVALATPPTQCAGTALSFTPTVGNAGSTPTYAWYVNGAQVATTATYTNSTLKNGDQVKVTVTPAAGTCSTGPVSTAVTVTLTPLAAATVTLAAPAAQCAGSSLSFTPTVGNAGSSPTYAWFVNGSQVATTTTYASSILKNGDQVKVTVTPTAGTCNTGAVSATVSVTLTPLATATVTLTAPAAQCVGSTLTFAPAVGSAGASPTYAWFVNGTQVATTASYSSAALKNGDQVKVTVTPTAGTCNTGPVSASVTVSLTPITAATVSLATPAAQCAGTAFSFTPTVGNAGSAPTYAWFVNGAQVATTATYTSSTLKNGDQVKVTVTPTAGTCNTGPVSASVTISTASPVVATVTLATPAPQCPGTSFSFVPVVGNAGASPTYTWYVNNLAVSNAPTFSSGTLSNGDQIKVVVTPTAGLCSTGAVSATATVSIIAAPHPNVVISAKTPLPVCMGEPIEWQVVSYAGTVSSPTFQWLVGGAAVAGATGSTFSSSQVANGQAVSVVLSTTTACGTFTAASNVVAAQVSPAIQVLAGPDKDITEGEQVVLEGQASGAHSVRWTPARSLTYAQGDTLRPVAAPLVTTVYTLYATAGACTGSSQVTVTVHPRLGIPSAISPNGDGQDDTWEIDHIGDYPSNHVVVFNRWGQQVFESSDYGRGHEWDGYIKGQPAPVGTYYYTIKLANGKSYSGPLTVLY